MRKDIILVVDANPNPGKYELHDVNYKYIGEYIDNVTNLEKLADQIKDNIKNIKLLCRNGGNIEGVDKALKCFDYDTLSIVSNVNSKDMIVFEFNWYALKANIFFVNKDISDKGFVDYNMNMVFPPSVECNFMKIIL